jgi:hypothetical protein
MPKQHQQILEKIHYRGMRIITDKGLTNLKGMLTTMHMQTISLRKYSLSVH